jgi:hypothetical protein
MMEMEAREGQKDENDYFFGIESANKPIFPFP